MPRRKALKVVVDIEFHAVTCPGVFLPDREDVFINVEIFGQLKRTQYHPPVFPFLFHERIRFEKVFCSATDPIQVAQDLCGESVSIELVQLSYPGGDLLGTYTDNARDFLFPTPKVSPTYPGVDREVLFERSASFPGIAPKLEFSSRTTIKEVTASGRSFGEKKHKERSRSHAGMEAAPRKNNTKEDNIGRKTSPQKQKTPVKKTNTKFQATAKRGRSSKRSKSASRGTTMWGYEQPTIASRARSPSPYAHRRMAELSIKDPFESATRTKPFKTEVDSRPEFVVRKVSDDALSLERTPPPPRTPSCERKSPRQNPSIRTQASPGYHGSYSSPRNGYEIPLSNSSDDSTSVSSGMSDEYIERGGHLIKPRPIRPWRRASSYLDSYNEYLMQRQGRCFPEGRCEKFIPIRSPHFSRQSTPRSATPKYMSKSPVTCSCCPPKRRGLKPCLVSHSAPPIGRTWRQRTSSNDRRRTADRITACLEGILDDCTRANSSRKKWIDNVHVRGKSKGYVRFKDASDIHTSMRCGRGSPTSARISSARSTSPRQREPSFSLRDLDTVPTSTFGRRPGSANAASSILNRPSLEERLRAQPSPYEKIRDRVRCLLQSPRATRIAEDAMQEGEERYRHRMSRSPSPRSPRVSVRLNDNEHWNEMASMYTGKSHRAVFESNLDKIYDDIYTKLKNEST